ncbi:hypothetical protein HWC21_gp143 [Vibrio phage VAP7]|uniref:Uncharacterized protein n=1 Tax=Vibrio phage VAP7 TaxID=2584487 RepID=A0A4Y5TWB3_9CAUD|nr:hypothetical protein HWC21_gp143 [Vibrio phage VAP7]QDB73325.1 hypothetical protein [Vibrio phage VAP7]UFD98183.1 hypothetical protein [Vibrio phage BX-1]
MSGEIRHKEINPWIPALIGPFVTVMLAAVGLVFYLGQRDQTGQMVIQKIDRIEQTVLPQIDSINTQLGTLDLKYTTLNNDIGELKRNYGTMANDVSQVKLKITAMTGDAQWQK